MLTKTARTLGALALAVSTHAFASSFYLGPGTGPLGYEPSSSITDYTLSVTNGEINNSFEPGEPPVFNAPTDVSKFSYTLVLSPDGSLSGPKSDGTVTGHFAGTYSISYDGSLLSAGTVTADGSESFIEYEVYARDSEGHVILDGDGNPVVVGTDFAAFGAAFTGGRFTQTSGVGIPGFAADTTSAAFEGEVGWDGFLYFSGSLSDTPAASAVPLPASATMGLGLIGLLGVAQAVRRRSRTA